MILERTRVAVSCFPLKLPGLLKRDRIQELAKKALAEECKDDLDSIHYSNQVACLQEGWYTYAYPIPS
jgi:hypothetical protein